MPRSLKDDLDLVLSLLPKVREIALHYYEMQDLEVERKADAGNSPVTQADIEIDHFLNEKLLAQTTGYGWLSEEIEDDGSRLTKERVWIVDPIDGTVGFVKRNDGFAVSIGLVENGVPVLGVIYAPTSDECIHSIKGSGVYLNGERMDVDHELKVARALFLTSCGETGKGMWQPYDGVLKQKPTGSMAQKLADLAVGRGDAMVSLRPKSVWDMAAGHALCIEAGLKVTDFLGNDILYNQQATKVDRVIVAPNENYDDVFNFFHK